MSGFADTPINLGTTRAGASVHRLSYADPVYSPCGEYMRHRFVKTPIEVSGPLCEKCFDRDELHAVNLAWMERH